MMVKIVESFSQFIRPPLQFLLNAANWCFSNAAFWKHRTSSNALFEKFYLPKCYFLKHLNMYQLFCALFSCNICFFIITWHYTNLMGNLWQFQTVKWYVLFSVKCSAFFFNLLCTRQERNGDFLFPFTLSDLFSDSSVIVLCRVCST